MNRTTTIGYILILGLFMAYFYINKQTIDEMEQQQAADSAAMVASQDSLAAPPAEVQIAEVPVVERKVETFRIENDKLVLDVANMGGQAERIQVKNYRRSDSSDLVLYEDGQLQTEYMIPLASGQVVRSSELVFEPTSSSETSLVLEARVDSLRSIIQHYELSEGSYVVEYEVEFKGFSQIISPKNNYVQLDWKGRVQQQESNVEDEEKATTIYYKYYDESGRDYLKESGEDDETLKAGIHWISFKQKFFNSTMIHPEGLEEGGIEIATVERVNDEYVEDLSASMYLPIDPGSDGRFAWQYYYGPNHYQTLKRLDNGMHRIIPLGWGIFGWVNKGLVIPVFNWLSQYIGNYGLIILFLTLLIKLLLAIPMFKVYQSQAKMKVLKPELDELKAKHGEDMQRLQQEQMKLYKQAGVNPLGGCLPQLIQLPILFAMFRFFPSSIELRQESLWWAHDLSTYDSIWDFPGGFSIPFYGDHVSLFTLLMTAVTLLYTFMNSQSTASLAGPMKYMMYFMPIMFLGFFNNYSAALSFYYFLSTCITIIQNVVIRKVFIDEDKLHRQIQDNKKKKPKVGKSRFQKRLEDMAKQRGVDPYTGKPKGQGNRPKGGKKKR